MDEELLKKLLNTFGVDPAKTPDAIKTAQELIKSSSSGTRQNAPDPRTDKLRDGLMQSAQRDVDYANSKEGQRASTIANVEGSIAARLKSEPRRMITSSRQPVDNQEKRIRAAEYAKAGLADPAAERRSAYDLNSLDKKAEKLGVTRDEYESMNPIDRMRKESEPAQRRAAELKAQTEGIRSGNANSIKENLDKGNNAFEGMKTPGQVKAEMRAAGQDEFAASQAAGQQFRDMFSTKGAQGDVLRAAGKEGKAMEVYDALKQSRTDNLQKISQDRIASGAKPVGSVQSIEAAGRVLAQRTGQEEGTRVASSGIDGALGRTVDGPGRMELTDVGKKLVADRTLSYTSPILDEKGKPSTEDGEGNNTLPSDKNNNITVAGKYGTAVGGKLNFPEALTSDQKLGLAPLSKANQEYKDATLASMRATAVDKGSLSGGSGGTLGQLAQALPQQVKAEMASSPISRDYQSPNQSLTEAFGTVGSDGRKTLPTTADRPVPVPKENSNIAKALSTRTQQDALQRKLEEEKRLKAQMV